MHRRAFSAIAMAGLLWMGSASSGRGAPPPISAYAVSLHRETVVIPAGTLLRVRLNQSLGTRYNHPGDRFAATLELPLVVDGGTAIPRGTQVCGVVREALPSGRLKGRAILILALDGMDANGRHLSIATQSLTRQSDRHRKHNAWWLGSGTGAGALLGGLAGGPAGFGIGLGAGASAGFTGAVLTGREQVRVPVETMISFRLDRSVTL